MISPYSQLLALWEERRESTGRERRGQRIKLIITSYHEGLGVQCGGDRGRERL